VFYIGKWDKKINNINKKEKPSRTKFVIKMMGASLCLEMTTGGNSGFFTLLD
jgi:hypothetical protein